MIFGAACDEERWRVWSCHNIQHWTVNILYVNLCCSRFVVCTDSINTN